MDDHYWELMLHDGTAYMIPPSGVDLVKRRLSNKETINTRSAVIPANQVKSFIQTEKRFTTQPLLEDTAAQAFNSPVINPDQSIACRWVKKEVTRQKYEQHYSKVPGYRLLSGDSGIVMVAMFIPIHDINPQATPYCTDSEVKYLTTRQ